MNHLTSCVLTGIILLFMTSGAMPQDLVVTAKGDSINAEITKITDDFIYYAYFKDGKVVRVKSPKSEISSYLYIFYSGKRVIDYSFDLNNLDFRIGFSGGGSWGLEAPPDNLNSFDTRYWRNVNSGWSYKIEAEYFVKNRLAIGLNVDRFLSTVLVENVTFPDSRTGALADDIRITYVGPLLMYHIDTKQDYFTVFVSIGAGNVWYRNDFIQVDPSAASGSAIGLHVAASMDFVILNHVMLGVEVSATYASLDSFTVEDSNGNIETVRSSNDLSRISTSLGFRIVK